MPNKFDLPAFFNREYYESRYLKHRANNDEKMAKIWEDFYFDNAVAYAWVQVFDTQKYIIGSKKAMVMADKVQKDLEKEYK